MQPSNHSNPQTINCAFFFFLLLLDLKNTIDIIYDHKGQRLHPWKLNAATTPHNAFHEEQKLNAIKIIPTAK